MFSISYHTLFFSRVCIDHILYLKKMFSRSSVCCCHWFIAPVPQCLHILCCSIFHLWRTFFSSQYLNLMCKPKLSVPFFLSSSSAVMIILDCFLCLFNFVFVSKVILLSRKIFNVESVVLVGVVCSHLPYFISRFCENDVMIGYGFSWP